MLLGMRTICGYSATMRMQREVKLGLGGRPRGEPDAAAAAAVAMGFVG